jgi:fructose-bisphosphate aldolase class II
VLVEAELGYIGQSSKILDEIPEGVMLGEESLTNPEKAKEFVELTGIDMLAPAIGNFHGMLRGGSDPKLNIERVKQISEATGIPLVLHGGSGNSEDDFKRSIANGVAIVHINTEIRVAYKQGLQIGLTENPDEVAPYKFLKPSVKAVQDVVDKKLRFFNNL